MNKRTMQAEHIVHFRFGWPVGMQLQLRLRRAPFLASDYAHLGGCTVIVTGLASKHLQSSTRKQFVYLLQDRDERFSSERVRPEDMELIPNIDPVMLQVNQAVLNALPDWWYRTIKPSRYKQLGG